MSVLYSDLIDYHIQEDNNMIKLTYDGHSTILYFDSDDSEPSKDIYLKDILKSNVLRIFAIEYLSPFPLPKPSRDKHSWVVVAGDMLSKLQNKYSSSHMLFRGDLLIMQRCDGKLCAVPRIDILQIPQFYLTDISEQE